MSITQIQGRLSIFRNKINIIHKGEIHLIMKHNDQYDMKVIVDLLKSFEEVIYNFFGDKL